MDRLKVKNLKRFLEVLNECSPDIVFEFTKEYFGKTVCVGMRTTDGEMYNMLSGEVVEWRSTVSEYRLEDYYIE